MLAVLAYLSFGDVLSAFGKVDIFVSATFGQASWDRADIQVVFELVEGTQTYRQWLLQVSLKA